MDKHQKVEIIAQAFEKLSDEYVAEGRSGDASCVMIALSQLEPDSAARLYDILVNPFKD